MNLLAYVCTLEFISSKSAQASRISMIGLPVICYNCKLVFIVYYFARSGQFIDSLQECCGATLSFKLNQR